jgi:GxxExxY protein
MYPHQDLTATIIKCNYNVFNQLGYGFLEKVYENAMLIELARNNIQATQQEKIEVFFRGKRVGLYFADLLVERKVIVELKSAEAITDEHETQLINYLKATEIEVGLVLNFGPKAEFRRKIFTNDRKSHLESV